MSDDCMFGSNSFHAHRQDRFGCSQLYSVSVNHFVCVSELFCFHLAFNEAMMVY